ncbi:hypothetical protein BN948_05016 [Hydrogenophaga intermedia]|uniref:Uncharacterized protein n=2 Tax=Hydrogenophaga intermedia TaxID=65786 RepID=A0A1L1Q183_HYDIT|nr:hypothetical protein BN948_05016 [Hydrogenophaga intermedia]
MSTMTTADALRLAINVLRDCAESGRMPSGIDLDSDSIALQVEAAEILDEALKTLRDHE